MASTTGAFCETTSVTCPFSFDGSYRGDELHQQVADILGLDGVRGWEIVDRDIENNLVLIHYRDDADMVKYGYLRGILVDLESKSVVANSFGYTPTATMNKLEEVNGQFVIRDDDGEVHTFNKATTTLRRAYEGVVVRVVWHNGKMLRITHRHIHAERSRWGTSQPFLAMYDAANGPKAEDLFDTSKPYSSTCFSFLVVDPALLVATRQVVEKPYLVFLGAQETVVNRSGEQVAKGKTLDLQQPDLLTLEEANKHLASGYYDDAEAEDVRMKTGEALIVSDFINGRLDVVKVQCPANQWRSFLRGNNPNIEHQFYVLLSMVLPDVVNNDKAWENMTKNLICFPLYDIQSVQDTFTETGGILALPSEKFQRANLTNRDNRIHLLWLNYILSLPPSSQQAGINILSKFYARRQAVVNWVQALEKKYPGDQINSSAARNEILALLSQKSSEVTKQQLDKQNAVYTRVQNLVNTSRSLARKKMEQGNTISYKGTHMSLPVLIKDTLRNLLCKEEGVSLYRLMLACP